MNKNALKLYHELMKKGWVAMDKNKRWYWHRRKPTKLNSPWNYWDSKGSDFELLMFH